MNGHTLAQSDLAGLSGQHGIPSAMSMAVLADVTTSIDIAIVGAAMGPRTSPSMARAASRWRMVNRRFTAVGISHWRPDEKGAAFTIAAES
jgi:hypothetical protein